MVQKQPFLFFTTDLNSVLDDNEECAYLGAPFSSAIAEITPTGGSESGVTQSKNRQGKARKMEKGDIGGKVQWKKDCFQMEGEEGAHKK